MSQNLDIQKIIESAKQGNATAQSNLGVLYAKGQGVEQNLLLSYAWFKIASDNGHKTAKENSEKIKLKLTGEQFLKAEELYSNSKVAGTTSNTTATDKANSQDTEKRNRSFYCFRNKWNREVGPVSLDYLKEAFVKQEINKFTPVRRKEQSEWLPLGERVIWEDISGENPYPKGTLVPENSPAQEKTNITSLNAHLAIIASIVFPFLNTAKNKLAGAVNRLRFKPAPMMILCAFVGGLLFCGYLYLGPKKYNISGEIFVVTQDRSNIKLGLTEVLLLDADGVNNIIKDKKEYAITKRSSLRQSMIALKSEIKQLQGLANNASNKESEAWQAHHKRNDEIRDNLSKGKFQNDNDTNYKTQKIEEAGAYARDGRKLTIYIMEKDDVLNAMSRDYDYYGSGNYFKTRSLLLFPIAKTITDSDGKFSLPEVAFTKGRQYVLAAYAERKVVTRESNLLKYRRDAADISEWSKALKDVDNFHYDNAVGELSRLRQTAVALAELAYKHDAVLAANEAYNSETTKLEDERLKSALANNEIVYAAKQRLLKEKLGVDDEAAKRGDEQYLWLIKLPANLDQEITLSNHNEVTTACQECVSISLD